MTRLRDDDEYVPVDAYFCGFSSAPKQRGWTATVKLCTAAGEWTELASWECKSLFVRATHKRQAKVALTHMLGKPPPDFLVNGLVDRMAYSLTRMEIPELRSWAADYGQQLALL